MGSFANGEDLVQLYRISIRGARCGAAARVSLGCPGQGDRPVEKRAAGQWEI